MKQYHEHLKAILAKGSYKEPAREGMPGTISLFGYQNRYNLQDGFPILTTKKISFKNIVVELLWFLRGDTNIKYLVDNGCNIWNEDAFNFYRKVCKDKNIIPSLNFDDFILHRGIKPWDDDNYIYGDCGFQYGKVWRQWETGKNLWDETKTLDDAYIGKKTIDQLSKVIQNIKSKPYDRRKVITAVDPAHDEDLALYWCHCLFQFNCRRLTNEEIIEQCRKLGDSCNNMDEGSVFFGGSMHDISFESWKNCPLNPPLYYLDCQMYQRSADMFLGVPYNISSYALLTHIIAKICNMVPGEFVHTFGDSHIYDNHKEQVKEILDRDPEKYKLPRLNLSEVTKWEELGEDNRFDILTPLHFSLEGYESYPAIKAELSTGLKK